MSATLESTYLLEMRSRVAHWFCYDRRPWSLNERPHPLRLHDWRSEWREVFGTMGLTIGKAQRLERVLVLSWPRYGRSPLDVGNEAGATKAAVDGLVDAQVIPGDGPAYVRAVIHLAPERGHPDCLRIGLVAL
jgi:hypothetical protein